MAVLAGVAGCRVDNPLWPPPGARPAPQEQPLPVLPGGGAGAEEAQVAASEPALPAPEPEATPHISPDSLIGLDREAVKTLLGPPTFVRRDKPTELWRYRHGSCALALFLYADGPGRDAPFRVRHIES